MASDKPKTDLHLMDSASLKQRIRPMLDEASDDVLREVLQLLLEKVKVPEAPSNEQQIRDTYHKFSEDFPAGTTADKLVEAFHVMKQADPKATPRDLLGDLVK